MFTFRCVDAQQKETLFSAIIDLPFHASKKNGNKIRFNPRTGRRFVGASPRVQKAAQILLLELRERARRLRLTKPINHRVSCVLIFGFPADQFYTRKLIEKRTLGDCSNLAQIVEDALEKAGIVENDCLLAPLYVDHVPSDNLCVSITLSRQP